MPKEITNDDGVVETVYSKEEVEGLQAGSDKNKERKQQIADLSKEMDIQEGETFEDKLKEMKENANPNFAKFRKKHNAMEKELKEGGKSFDDNGTLIDGAKPLSSDDIAKQIEDKVKEVVSSTTSSSTKDQALAGFTKEDRATIEPHLDKLMTIYPGDIQGNLELAVNKAFPTGMPDAVKQTLGSSSGQGPRINTTGKKEKYSDTEAGKQALSQLLPDHIKKAQAEQK